MWIVARTPAWGVTNLGLVLLRFVFENSLKWTPTSPANITNNKPTVLGSKEISNGEIPLVNGLCLCLIFEAFVCSWSYLWRLENERGEGDERVKDGFKEGRRHHCALLPTTGKYKEKDAKQTTASIVQCQQPMFILPARHHDRPPQYKLRLLSVGKALLVDNRFIMGGSN